MTKSKKVHVVLALILYPPFILMIIAMVLLLLFEKGIIENELIYNFLTRIDQMVDPYQWPWWGQTLLGISIFAVIIVIITAELSLHKGILKRAKRAADEAMEENLRNTTTSYTSPTITFDSTGTGHVSGGYSSSRPILNFSRIWQVLLYVILIVLTPIIFPFDAIIHLIIYRGITVEDELDEDEI